MPAGARGCARSSPGPATAACGRRTASAWGDAFATVTLSLLVLDRTGSGIGVAGVVAAEIAPGCYPPRRPACWSTGSPGPYVVSGSMIYGTAPRRCCSPPVSIPRSSCGDPEVEQ
jgi:hypothetical protein